LWLLNQHGDGCLVSISVDRPCCVSAEMARAAIVVSLYPTH
jgi:hypothetical protein